VINFILLLKIFNFFLQFLNQDFIFLLVVLNIAIDSFNFPLEGLDIKFDFVELLILVIGDIVQNFALKLL
jgi:hypothetical protein